MRVAVCGGCAGEVEQICSWVSQYCQVCGCPVELCPIGTVKQLRQDTRSFYAAFIGFGDSAGFLAARELRDRGRQCRIVLIDDTSRYVIRGHRIHATYFIVRPLEMWHIVRSMDLIMGRRAY